MNIKKHIAFFTALIVLLLSGCSGTSDVTGSSSPSATANPSSQTSLSVLYSSKDTLDPYTCITKQNEMLTQLIYDPLLILDNSYNVIYKLASSVITDKGVCTVTLKSAAFSDGSPVTAKDVVFSFNKAKKSTTTTYAAALKYAKSADAVGNNKVVITLTKNDPDFANLLTFPIMKTDSDALKDIDNRSLPPIGAGKFVFDTATSELNPNKYYYGAKSVITKIITVDCPDNEAVMQAIKAGMVDIYYSDLTDNVIPKMNGNTADINQNLIVFLGINPTSPTLQSSYMRQAISSAIDRNDICSSAYHSKAATATGPFPAFWQPTTGYMTIEPTTNQDISVGNINLAGYTNKNKDGFFVNAKGDVISLSLLVNNENASRMLAAEKIADNLAKVGIKINIKAVTLKEYLQHLKTKSYDLYIGEIRMENNMDLGGLVNLNSADYLIHKTAEDEEAEKADSDDKKKDDEASVSASTKPDASKPQPGEDGDEGETGEDLTEPPVQEITLTSLDAYNGYYNGIYSLQDLITAFTAELPVIPVCFKKGLVIYSNRFPKGLAPSVTSLFNGI